MSKRCPKTTGIDWLYLSLASFNGSGYADKTTPETYVASYIGYKTWKKDKEAVLLVRENMSFSLDCAERLCHARDASHTPSMKNILKFVKFYSPDRTWEILG